MPTENVNMVKKLYSRNEWNINQLNFNKIFFNLKNLW